MAGAGHPRLQAGWAEAQRPGGGHPHTPCTRPAGGTLGPQVSGAGVRLRGWRRVWRRSAGARELFKRRGLGRRRRGRPAARPEAQGPAKRAQEDRQRPRGRSRRKGRGVITRRPGAAGGRAQTLEDLLFRTLASCRASGPGLPGNNACPLIMPQDT